MTIEEKRLVEKRAIIEGLKKRLPGCTTYIGIDKSLTSTGICIIYADGSILQDEIGSKGFGVDRIKEICQKVIKHCVSVKNPFVCMEGYAFDRMNRSHELGELGGVLKLFLNVKNIPWLEVPPTTLKKFVAKKGNAPKNLMPMWISKRFGFEPIGGDAADAIGCAFLLKCADEYVKGHFKGAIYENEAIESFLSLSKKKRKKSTNKKNKELAAQIDE